MTLYERMNTIALVQTYATDRQDLFGLNDRIYSDVKRGMSFTVGETGNNEANLINIIKIQLKRVGNPGNLSCQLYAADAAHKPTGSVLAASSFSQGNFPIGILTSSLFSMTPSYVLQAGLEYCFVLSASGGDFSYNYYVLYVSMSANE